MTTKQPSFVFDGRHQTLIRVFQIWQGKVIKAPPASNQKSERFLSGEKMNSWTKFGRGKSPAKKFQNKKMDKEKVGERGCAKETLGQVLVACKENIGQVLLPLDWLDCKFSNDPK